MSSLPIKCPVCAEYLIDVPSGQTCLNGCIGIMPFPTTAVKGKRSYPLPASRKSQPGKGELFDKYDNTGAHDG